MKFKSDLQKSGKVIKFPGNYQPPQEKEIKTNNFAMFAFSIVGGQIDLAAKIIGDILSLDEHWAHKAAQHYNEAYHRDHSIQSEAMHIKNLIRENQNNEALMAIYKCFGLQGPPAVAALESMRAIVMS